MWRRRIYGKQEILNVKRDIFKYWAIADCRKKERKRERGIRKRRKYSYESTNFFGKLGNCPPPLDSLILENRRPITKNEKDSMLNLFL